MTWTRPIWDRERVKSDGNPVQNSKMHVAYYLRACMLDEVRGTLVCEHSPLSL